MVDDNNPGDEEEGKGLILSETDPKLIHQVAVSLMSEDWFKNKLTEKITRILTKNEKEDVTADLNQAGRSLKVEPMGDITEESPSLLVLGGETGWQDDTIDLSGRRGKRHKSEKMKASNRMDGALIDLSGNSNIHHREKIQSRDKDNFATLESIRRTEEKMYRAHEKMNRTQNKMTGELVAMLGRIDKLEEIKHSDHQLARNEEIDENRKIPWLEKRRKKTPTGSIIARNWFENMPEDTFSLMMISRPSSNSWFASTITFIFQMSLGILIAYDQIRQGMGSSIFNVPFTVDPAVRLAQFMAVLFCVLTQSDILTSIQSISLLWKTSRWDMIVLGRDADAEPPSTWEWTIHILLPNAMKLIQGLNVMFVSFVVIVQSNTIIDLLKDFTALIVVSELDNLVFNLIASGYVGKDLQIETTKVQNIEYSELSARNPQPLSAPASQAVRKCDGFALRPTILGTIVSAMIGGWLWIVLLQVNGDIFRKRFPNCDGVNHVFAKEHFGDGICYGGKLNTLGCEFEGGDCINFNLEYPLCRGNDLINVQNELSNEDCNKAFAIPECNFDNNKCCSPTLTEDTRFGDGICNFVIGEGSNIDTCKFENGDCLQYNADYCSENGQCCPPDIYISPSFGDGICNGGISASSQCDYDDKDCNAFKNAHPSCPFDELSTIEGNTTVIIGDGVCDSGVYNLFGCGWEYGDCAVGQIGQDLVGFGSIFDPESRLAMNAEMSLDGSTLVVVMQNGSFDSIVTGRVKIFNYLRDTKMWKELSKDFNFESFTSEDRSSKIVESYSITIAMNWNGTRVAVGNPALGVVRAFDINPLNEESPFSQVGQFIRGQEDGDLTGISIDLTSDGSMLAVSSPFNTVGGKIETGRVQIFSLQDTLFPSPYQQDKEWVKIGEVFGPDDFSTIGQFFLQFSSNNGTTTIIFSSAGPGIEVFELLSRVYTLNGTSPETNLIQPDSNGSRVISGDGNRIASASNDSRKPSTPGSVEVFDYNPVTKTSAQIGEVLYKSQNSQNGDGFGFSLALSNDGKFLAISSVATKCVGEISNYCATGTIELFAFNPFDKKFYAPIPSPSNIGNSSMIEEENEHLREKSIFGMQLFWAESTDNDGVTSTWLSVRSFNFALGEGYMRVYNMDEQFYTKCEVQDPSLIRNGFCNDNLMYNTEECGWDGGDCIQAVDGYPDCLVHDPFVVGNGECNDSPIYNTEECGWDGSDCKFYNSLVNCTVAFVNKINNGECDDYPPYNTEECGWDGGDCNLYNALVNCTVAYPSKIGDGNCDYYAANTEKCGWDGGDCNLLNSLANSCTGYRFDYIGDGFCNDWPPYNMEECGWDGGDCERNPVDGYPDCFVHAPFDIGNGFCTAWPPYNTEECGWDGGDCPSPSP